MLSSNSFRLRQSWVQDTFLSNKSDSKLQVKCLPSLDCFDKLSDRLLTFTRDTKFDFELDGYLFYKNESCYTFGICDDSLWLLPDMLNEILFNIRPLTGELSALEKMNKDDEKHARAQTALKKHQECIGDDDLYNQLANLSI
ncbi:hypothetical protein GJ496_010772 [Pomphorhynchus laevis]|nr:hypothetical protein GJ496_010772 [Pomphorhynchus laevis]